MAGRVFIHQSKVHYDIVLVILKLPVASLGLCPLRIWFSTVTNKFMMVIRNPIRTVLPYSANIKYIKYHGLVGQMTIEKWKEICAKRLETMMDEWLNQIGDWRKSSNFELGLYIVFEDFLMNPKKGLDVLQEMAKVF